MIPAGPTFQIVVGAIGQLARNPAVQKGAGDLLGVLTGAVGCDTGQETGEALDLASRFLDYCKGGKLTSSLRGQLFQRISALKGSLNGEATAEQKELLGKLLGILEKGETTLDEGDVKGLVEIAQGLSDPQTDTSFVIPGNNINGNGQVEYVVSPGQADTSTVTSQLLPGQDETGFNQVYDISPSRSGVHSITIEAGDERMFDGALEEGATNGGDSNVESTVDKPTPTLREPSAELAAKLNNFKPEVSENSSTFISRFVNRLKSEEPNLLKPEVDSGAIDHDLEYARRNARDVLLPDLEGLHRELTYQVKNGEADVLGNAINKLRNKELLTAQEHTDLVHFVEHIRDNHSIIPQAAFEQQLSLNKVIDNASNSIVAMIQREFNNGGSIPGMAMKAMGIDLGENANVYLQKEILTPDFKSALFSLIQGKEADKSRLSDSQKSFLSIADWGLWFAKKLPPSAIQFLPMINTIGRMFFTGPLSKIPIFKWLYGPLSLGIDFIGVNAKEMSTLLDAVHEASSKLSPSTPQEEAQAAPALRAEAAKQY